jgi:hypothetical protein
MKASRSSKMSRLWCLPLRPTGFATRTSVDEMSWKAYIKLYGYVTRKAVASSGHPLTSVFHPWENTVFKGPRKALVTEAYYTQKAAVQNKQCSHILALCSRQNLIHAGIDRSAEPLPSRRLQVVYGTFRSMRQTNTL